MNAATGVSMRALAVVIVATVGLLLTSQGLSAQRKPDFSGTWVYVAAEAAVTRNGGKGPVRVIEVSGAAFNCGVQCTIVQNAQTFSVSPAALENGVKRPDVVLNIAGGESTVTQSLQPLVQYPANAEWNGDQLVVTRSMGVLSIRQTIALEKNQLIVTSLIMTGGPDDAPVRQTYARK